MSIIIGSTFLIIVAIISIHFINIIIGIDIEIIISSYFFSSISYGIITGVNKSITNSIYIEFIFIFIFISIICINYYYVLFLLLKV